MMIRWDKRRQFVNSLIELLEISTDEQGNIKESNSAKLDSFYDQLNQYDSDNKIEA